MDASFIKSLHKTLNSASVMNCGPRWRLINHTAVGGALAAGFDQRNNDFLVVSQNQQSLFDIHTGEQIYRNREASSYNRDYLQATRLDDPCAPPIPMSGEDGGGLCTTTSDGWSVDTFPVDWPTTFSVLHPPKCSIYFIDPKWTQYSKDSTFYLVQKGVSKPVAFGFSWSGEALVWMDRSDLMIWRRIN